MGKTLIIAEKPSVGKEIASIVGARDKNNIGYYEGNNYIVFWAFGHLVGLAMPDTYGEKEWNLSRLPIVPTEFIYEVGANSGVQKQFRLLSDLLNSPEISQVVSATDAGREGEAIFRYIYYQAKCTKPVKRLWISSLTEESIRTGMQNLKDSSEFDNIYYSAKARNEADWIIGINSTRAITLVTKSKSVISLGRVQTPTLAIICDRFLQNKNFKSKPFFTAKVAIDNKGNKIEIRSSSKFNTQDEAKAYLAKINQLKVIDLKENRVEEKPPLPFDLTSLQITANRRYGYKAQATLDLAQTLYEKKIISYPRTSSRYLGEDMLSDVSKVVDKCFESGIISSKPDQIEQFCFDNSKLSDHYAIIPTGENLDLLSSLSKDEKTIFDLVLKQFVTALYPKCIKDKINYTLSFDNESEALKLTAVSIFDQGWRAFGEDEKEKLEAEESEIVDMPKLELNSVYSVIDKQVKEDKTKPLPIHTEASLLRLMETAGNDSDDEELRRLMKDCGIGTPATRAGIIETLFARKFIQLSKKQLLPTELGLSVYDLVKDLPLANVTLTGDMEKSLNAIAEGKQNASLFYDEIKKVNLSILEEIEKIKVCLSTDKATSYKCLVCQSPITEKDKAFKCSSNECKFILWKQISGKDISKFAKDFFDKGQTPLIEGLKSSQGKLFSAILAFDASKENYLTFKFPDNKVKDHTCLLCNSSLIRYQNAISCEKKCGFFIPLVVASKKLPEKEILLLLEGKKSNLIKGFQGKNGKFDAYLMYDKAKKKFEFMFDKK